VGAQFWFIAPLARRIGLPAPAPVMHKTYASANGVICVKRGIRQNENKKKQNKKKKKKHKPSIADQFPPPVRTTLYV